MLADFDLHRHGGAAIWLARKYAEQGFLDRLIDADTLFTDPSCQLVKDQRKIKVARLVVEFDGKPQGLFIKRYNMFSWRHRLVSVAAHGGAFRALRGAKILRDAGIDTARPVAAITHRRCGFLTKSFYLTEELVGGATVDAYWREVLRPLTGREGQARRRDFLLRLGQLFHQLHERGVYHNDLKDANILAVPQTRESGYRLCLLDLEGVRRYSELSANRKLKNLVQINRTLGKLLRRCDRLIFLKAYLDRSFGEHALRHRLVETVERRSRRLDVAKGLASMNS